MGFRIKDGRELMSAAVLALAGVAVTYASVSYELGDAFNMGPGYFPLVLGLILMVLALVTAFGALGYSRGSSPASLRGGRLIDVRAIWAVVIVCGSFAGFAALLPVLGLSLTCFIVLFAASTGSGLLKPLEGLATALILSTASVVIFVVLLGLQIKIWPW